MESEKSFTAKIITGIIIALITSFVGYVGKEYIWPYLNFYIAEKTPQIKVKLAALRDKSISPTVLAEAKIRSTISPPKWVMKKRLFRISIALRSTRKTIQKLLDKQQRMRKLIFKLSMLVQSSKTDKILFQLNTLSKQEAQIELEEMKSQIGADARKIELLKKVADRLNFLRKKLL